jgi:hypothetical protein
VESLGKVGSIDVGRSCIVAVTRKALIGVRRLTVEVGLKRNGMNIKEFLFVLSFSRKKVEELLKEMRETRSNFSN